MSRNRNLFLALLAIEMGAIDATRAKEYAARMTAAGPADFLEVLVAEGAISTAQRDILDMMARELYEARIQAQIDSTPSLLAGLSDDSTAADSEDEALLPATPEAAGRYVFRAPDKNAAEIGRGALGRVLVAFDDHLAREVAVKELLPFVEPDDASDSEYEQLQRVALARTARFLREARVTGQLEHPSIVPVYEIGRRDDGTFYYTMKLVRGDTLDEALAACRNLDDRLQLLGHFEDVCQALAYAHSRGVIHRDVKPSNIMLGRFGVTVVLDWGLAKVRGQRDDRGLEIERSVEQLRVAGHTVVGQAIGTPTYMSPEQAEGLIEQIDERSDVWSLGAVLYKILTGSSPFEGRVPSEIIDRVKSETVRPVREVCAEAPPDLAAVAEKALCRDPGERYETAGELAEEVHAFRAGHRIAAYEYGSLELLRRFVRKNKALSALIALLAVTLVVGSALVWRAYGAARTALETAERNEREVHFNIANFLSEKALEAFGRRDFLVAKVFSAASLVHNPYNPFGPYRYPQLSNMEQTDAALRVSPSHSVLYQAAVHGYLSFDDVLVGHTDNVTAVAYSPDGSLLASAGGDKVIRIWHARFHRPIRVLTGHADSVRDVAFFAGGTRLISAGRDGVLIVWNPQTGERLGTLTGHVGEVRAVAVSPKGDVAASVGRDKTLRLWNLADGVAVATWDDHQGVVEDVTFSPDGRWLATVGRDKTIRLRDAVTGRTVAVLRGHDDEITAAAFTPDSKILATGAWDAKVHLWDVETRRRIGTLEGHTDGVRGLAFSADGRRLVTAGWDKTLKLWDVPQRRLIETVVGHADGVFAVAFEPGDEHIVSASGDKTIKVWRVARLNMVKTLHGHDDRIVSFSFSPDGALLASASWDNTLKLWDMETGKLRADVPAHEQGVLSVCFSPDGTTFATAGGDRTIKLWRLDTLQPIATLTGHEGAIRSLAFSPDGLLLASAGRDKTVRLWDVQTARPLATFTDAKDIVWTIDFSPDGRYVAGAAFDKTVRLWDVEKRTLARTLEGHTHWVSGVSFSPDGQVLASSGRDKTVRLWRVETGEPLAVITGHNEWVNYVEFSPDGRRLLTGSDDRTARLWDADTGCLLQTIRVSYEVASIAFTPRGDAFAVDDKEDIIVYPIDFDYWHRDPEGLLRQAESEAGAHLNGSDLAPWTERVVKRAP
ncbi:MAG: protein kinase [Candidatus Lernaella stagnicola]|nr:protein kinase [Candidatus Lernaella stagnicola]